MTGHVMKPGVDWVAIRREYEAGIASVRQLARRHLVSHTAINKKIRAQGWAEPERVSVPAAVETRLPSNPAKGDITDRKNAIIGHLVDGAPPNMAAMLADVRGETFGEWLVSDPSFAHSCKRAQMIWAQTRVTDINRASEKGDWRAGLALLERHPATKIEYGEQKYTGGAKVEIVFQGMPAPKAVTVTENGTRAIIEND